MCCVRACVRVCAIHMRCSGVELSVKPSLVDSAEVQRVSVLVDGDKITAGPVEVISTLQIQQVLIRTRIPEYTVCWGLSGATVCIWCRICEVFVTYNVGHCVPAVPSMLSIRKQLSMTCRKRRRRWVFTYIAYVSNWIVLHLINCLHWRGSTVSANYVWFL